MKFTNLHNSYLFWNARWETGISHKDCWLTLVEYPNDPVFSDTGLGQQVKTQIKLLLKWAV